MMDRVAEQFQERFDEREHWIGSDFSGDICIPEEELTRITMHRISDEFEVQRGRNDRTLPEVDYAFEEVFAHCFTAEEFVRGDPGEYTLIKTGGFRLVKSYQTLVKCFDDGGRRAQDEIGMILRTRLQHTEHHRNFFQVDMLRGDAVLLVRIME